MSTEAVRFSSDPGPFNTRPKVHVSAVSGPTFGLPCWTSISSGKNAGLILEKLFADAVPATPNLDVVSFVGSLSLLAMMAWQSCWTWRRVVVFACVLPQVKWVPG